MRSIAFLLPLASLVFAQRPLKVEDVHEIRNVSDPQVSPDGAWVAYVLSTIDKAADKSDSDVWMVSWDGAQNLRLTTSKEGESSPRWSPDGKWLAFTSSRGGAEAGSQVWLLPRAGGEAQQLTSFKGSAGEYVWSPDSKRLAVVVTERDEEPKKEADRPKTPKPLVIDRYHFKQDNSGYRTQKPPQIWLFDVETKKGERLTAESLEEGSPAWSPDGTRIAFLSNRAGQEAPSSRWRICIAGAKPGSAVRELPTGDAVTLGRGGRPEWSADGVTIHFLAGREPKYRAYQRMKPASIPASGGSLMPRPIPLDRSVSSLRRLSSGGLGFLVTDDMREYPATLSAGGAFQPLLASKTSVNAWHESAGRIAVMLSSDEAPAEVYALEAAGARALTRHNEAFLKGIQLGATRELSFRTRDGAEVHGLLTLPPSRQEGTKLPLLLRIHGGPNGQDSHSFQFERHLFAALGYAVLQVNYRGSSGRDEAFQTAIFADWGNKEVVDLLAGVDHVISLGIADPARLGIGGWSYGGILTNYAIATDARFKAATSGAGSSLQLSMYGSDQYIEQYDLEVGYPWKARDLWLKISYPFFQADRIKTPTLFLGGEKDFNVPIIGSEQMYQALRANGVDSRLIVYPGEFHGIRKPTYVQHRLEQYLAWYAKYLK
jgi:dipeptidyl aminopeptidase/acylaminoacyl peptidase